MAIVVADRVRETTSTSGTGTLTLNGAVAGYATFASRIGNNSTYYTIYDNVAQTWETGLGTVSSNTLARNTVYSNSLGTTAFISFAGNPTTVVYCTYPASKSVDTTTAQTISSKTLTSVPSITYSDNTAQTTAAGGFGFKNRIINGDANINQRSPGTAFIFNTTVAYFMDRWVGYQTANTATNFGQNYGATPPTAQGYPNCIAVNVPTAYTSFTATDYCGVYQQIEGYNIADLAWGTANAQPVSLSFWVKSPVTGTLGGFIANSAENRCYVFSYTINAANTYEYKTISIPGDTTGTWLTDTNVGMKVAFALYAGSSTTTTPGSWGSTLYRGPSGQASIYGTNGNTWSISGVQLEKGPTATAFDRRPYQTELALCYRYLYKSFSTTQYPQSNVVTGNVVFNCSTSNYLSGINFPVPMRVAPTVVTFNPYAANSSFRQVGTVTDIAISSYSATTWGISYFSCTLAAPASCHGQFFASADY